MTILVPPRADPNIACAVEGFSLFNTIGGLATSCTITVTPEVEYAAIPTLIGAPQHVKSDGSAATKIDSWAITTQATTGVTITVTLDAAPGAGITDTIVFNGGLIGIPAR
jgi:hypothetical protein